VGLFTTLGYFFGNIEIVRENFSLVIIAIVILSVLPPIYEVLKARSKPKQLATE
jgi:membrane-associated protein